MFCWLTSRDPAFEKEQVRSGLAAVRRQKALGRRSAGLMMGGDFGPFLAPWPSAVWGEERGVSTEVAFGQGNLSGCPLEGFKGAHE